MCPLVVFDFGMTIFEDEKMWRTTLISTCGVIDLRSSDVVPPLLLNFTQDQSGNVRFCCIDDRSMINKAKLSSSGGTTSLDRRSTTPHVY